MQRRSKCNSPPINGQCTNRCMVVRCSAVLMWQLKSYNRLVQAVPLKYFQFLYNLQCLHVIFFLYDLPVFARAILHPRKNFWVGHYVLLTKVKMKSLVSGTEAQLTVVSSRSSLASRHVA